MRLATTFAKAALMKRGYEVIRPTFPASASEGGIPHSVIRPGATYSPWRTDSEFLAVHHSVSSATLVDQYRCYELWQLVEQSAKLPSGALLQVGVWRGGTGALLAKRAQMLDIRDPVYLCDTFTGVVKASSRDTLYVGGEYADADVEQVQGLVDSLGLKRVEILTGIFPDDTADQIRNQTFRLCHIDVDVYQSASDIVDWLWPRLVPNGIVVFDDYGMHGCEGIIRFLEEQRRRPDRLLIYNLNGHGLLLKTGD
jgi:O-methyltransferase